MKGVETKPQILHAGRFKYILFFIFENLEFGS